MDEKIAIEILNGYGIPYDVLEGPRIEGILAPSDLISQAISDHTGDEGLEYLIGEKENIAIIVNDRNRPTPTHLILEYLMDEQPWMIPRIKKVVIATGSHKEPTMNDLEVILGRTKDLLMDKVHIHRSKDREAHEFLGRTSRGTELFFDKVLDDRDLLIFINSVEPHYFAGFTGGRKSIIPGIAYYDTIERNHSYALDTGSKTLALSGNPVHEDMMEACRMFMEGKDHLSFQIVQAPGKVITGLFVGDIFESFERAVEMAKTRFCTSMDSKYDLVIAFAKPPMDRTLYQAQKAIEHGKLALKRGGTIILVAECYEGIGQSKFWDLLTSSDRPEGVLSTIGTGYQLGYHKAARIVQLVFHSRIMAVAKISKEELKRGFIDGHETLEEAISEILVSDPAPKTLIIPDATVTVPLVNSKE